MLNGLMTEPRLLLVSLPRLRTHHQRLARIVMAVIRGDYGRFFRVISVHTDHPVRSEFENHKRQEYRRQRAA